VWVNAILMLGAVGSGVRTLRTRDISALVPKCRTLWHHRKNQRHFGTSAEVSARHFGTGTTYTWYTEMSD